MMSSVWGFRTPNKSPVQGAEQERRTMKEEKLGKPLKVWCEQAKSLMVSSRTRASHAEKIRSLEGQTGTDFLVTTPDTLARCETRCRDAMRGETMD